MAKQCSADNCYSSAKCKGLCQSHYMKQWHKEHPEQYQRGLERWSAYGKENPPVNRKQKRTYQPRPAKVKLVKQKQPATLRQRVDSSPPASERIETQQPAFSVPGKTFAERMIEYRKIYERAQRKAK